MIREYVGKLHMPEGNDLNKIQYIITKPDRSFNLTEKLNEIYFTTKECGLVINYKDEDVFCEVGTLYKYHGVWMINGVCIDHKLWDLSGEEITVIFDDLVEEAEEEDYGETKEIHT